MSRELKPLLAVVAGPESLDNLRLSDTLRRIIGKERVHRFLELGHLNDFVAKKDEHPIVVFLDIFGLDLAEATALVGDVRESHPTVVFNLYVDKEEYKIRDSELPGAWSERFTHYFKTYKEKEDVEFEPIVRNSLRISQDEAEENILYGPLQITPSLRKGLIVPRQERPDSPPPQGLIFISYSRSDWPRFVSQLVEQIKGAGFSLWIDQQLLIGGDDWMDSIGEALDKCKVLLLVISPEALGSRYVKMEYRYFFNHDKRIIPVLAQKVDRIPPELSTTQYIDFTEVSNSASFQNLIEVLRKHMVTAKTD